MNSFGHDDDGVEAITNIGRIADQAHLDDMIVCFLVLKNDYKVEVRDNDRKKQCSRIFPQHRVVNF